MDLRCDSGKKHGVLLRPSADDGRIEVKCNSRFCGHDKDTVILHEFSTHTGLLVATKRFRQPHLKGVAEDGSDDDSPSVRTP